jgi:hypothetical protein
MAPGHIDAEGHFIGDCPQFAPKNASKGTIFEQKVEKPATRQVMEPKKLAALLDKTFNEDMEAAVKVPTQEPMKVVPKIDEDALLADLLASTPPAPKVEATPTATEIGEEIVKLMKPKHPNVSFITAPEPAQSTTPNAAADTPTNVAADPSVRRDASATSGVDGTVVVVPEEPPGIDLVHVNGLKEALTCLPEYLASIDLKWLLVRLIEVTATIGTKLDGYRVILEQSAVTNTAALAELEERVKALEVKKPRKADKKAEE